MSRYKESPEYRELRCPCCGKPMQEMEVLDTYMGWDLGAGKEWQKYRGTLTKAPQSWCYVEVEE